MQCTGFTLFNIAPSVNHTAGEVLILFTQKSKTHCNHSLYELLQPFNPNSSGHVACNSTTVFFPYYRAITICLASSIFPSAYNAYW